MAKKKEETGVKKPFDFNAMDKALSKIPGFEMGSIIETNTFSQVDEYIPTGNYLLNAQISGSMFKGLPNNRSIALGGDPETGKTYLCLNWCREAQKVGYDIIYCETEGAVDRNTVSRIGCDTLKMRYQPINTVNKFKNFVVKVIEMVREARENGQNPKILLVLDSLGMLSTEKEMNDAAIGKDAMDMGIKAKQMRAMFRLITLDLAANKIPLICTNHTTTAGIGSYTGPTKEMASGDGPMFSFSTALMLSKKYEVNEKDKSDKTGIIITSRPKKSRNTRPIPVSVHVGFVGGMNPYVGLEDYISWDGCGIGRGKIMTDKEYKKLGVSTGKSYTLSIVDVDKATGEITTRKEELVYVPSEAGRWCVKHLGKSLQNGGLLFKKEVFTDDVLKELDENVIRPSFELPTHTNPEDLYGIDVFNETDETDED